MARPAKQGIDYFPLDVDFDDKIEMYLIEKEAVGLAVLITTWQLIYKNEGYYINSGKDLFLLIKKKISVDLNEIEDCINSCLVRGIFDKDLHEKFGILTSKAIQKRFFDVINKKKEVRYDTNFLLVEVSGDKNLINVGINSVNSEKTDGNVLNKIKEKKRKEKEIKENESKEKEIKINEIKENKIPSSGKPERDFIDNLLNLFLVEFKTARNEDYVLVSREKERSAISKLLMHYKTQNPDKNTEETLNDFENIFRQSFTVNDKFLQENISPSMILTKLNFIKTKLKGENYVRQNSTTGGATARDIAEAIAKAFDINIPPGSI